MTADPYTIPCPECFARMGERCKSMFLATAFDALRTPHAVRILAVTPRYVPRDWENTND
ncbi:zinc finger domain-containing protein [Rhodococcoides kyotonense]|uniref:DNA-binding phage zinc finger domain-containing protein n=1 Tax=Rhodococcoides kyotonense TaxID=398843 RepID=A0A239FLH8_9NOCA|nr:hypothetical protein [Rhodococcus kyotonensis]SNS57647.1 hypothetical protein SAMN05421642_103354 [Rhodococcus kyotonensis]